MNPGVGRDADDAGELTVYAMVMVCQGMYTVDGFGEGGRPVWVVMDTANHITATDL